MAHQTMCNPSNVKSAVMVTAWLCASVNVNAQMNPDLLQHAGVKVTAISSRPASPNGVGLSSIAGQIPKGALLISNESAKPIMVIVIKWVSTLEDGSTKAKWLYLDGYYFSPLQPVLSPGGEVLVTRYGSLPEDNFEQLAQNPEMHGSPLKSQYSGAPFRDIDTNAIIDAVIFADGEVVGNDVSHYEETVQLRHSVFLSMALELHTAGSANEARTVAQQIVLQTGTSSDPADRVRHQIARVVAGSNDPIALIAEFKNHSIPAKFYHSGSSK